VIARGKRKEEVGLEKEVFINWEESSRKGVPLLFRCKISRSPSNRQFPLAAGFQRTRVFGSSAKS